MSKVRVLTRNGTGFCTPTAGSKVRIGAEELSGVTSLELVGEAIGVWTLKISVNVDPADLFEPLSEAEQIEDTHMGSEYRQFVAGKA